MREIILSLTYVYISIIYPYLLEKYNNTILPKLYNKKSYKNSTSKT